MTVDFSSGSFPLCKLLENCLEITCRQALCCRGRRYLFVEIRYVLLPSFSRCCLLLLSFLFCGCMLGPGQTLRSFHGTFHWDSSGIFVLVGVCVHQNPCEVPVMLSAKLL